MLGFRTGIRRGSIYRFFDEWICLSSVAAMHGTSEQIRRFITVSEDGEEESYEIEEFEGIEVSTIEVVIDEAASEFQKAKVFSKKRKGTYCLSDLFQVLLDDDSEIFDLAVELETALSGYQDLIREDDNETATELIQEIRDGIKGEVGNSTLKS
jgi:hypothetical protein